MLFNNNEHLVGEDQPPSPSKQQQQQQQQQGDPPIFLPDSVSASRIRRSQEVIQHYFNEEQSSPTSSHASRNNDHTSGNDDNDTRRQELDAFRNYQQEEMKRLREEEKQKFTCCYAEYASCKECRSMCYDHPAIAFQRKDTRAFSTSIFLEYFHADCFIERFLKQTSSPSSSSSSLITSIQQFEGFADLSENDRNRVEGSIRKFLGIEVKQQKLEKKQESSSQKQIAEAIEEKELEQSPQKELDQPRDEKNNLQQAEEEPAVGNQEQQQEPKEESAQLEASPEKSSQQQESHLEVIADDDQSSPPVSSNDNEQATNIENKGNVDNINSSNGSKKADDDDCVVIKKRKWAESSTKSSADIQSETDDKLKKYALPHLIEIPELCTDAIQAKNKVSDYPQTSIAFHKLFFAPTEEQGDNGDERSFKFPLLHLLNPPYQATSPNAMSPRENTNNIPKKKNDKSTPAVPPRFITTLEEAVDEFLSQTACLQITGGPLITGINPVQYAACLGNILFVKKVYDIIVEKTKDADVGGEELKNKLLEKIFHDTVASNDRSISEFVCRGGNVELIKFFHSKNWLFPNILNANGGTPTFVFIQGHDDADTLKFLHKEAGSILEYFKSEADENYLQLAIRKNRKSVVNYLLENSEIDPNGKRKEETSFVTPFALAAKYGEDDEIIRMLFKHGGARVCLEEMKISLESMGISTDDDKNKQSSGGGLGSISRFKAQRLRRLKPDEKIEDLLPLTSTASTTGDAKTAGSSVTIFVKPRYFPVIPLGDALKLEQQDKLRQELEDEKKKQQLDDAANVPPALPDESSSVLPKHDHMQDQSAKRRLQEQAGKLLPFIDPNRRYILQGQIKRTKLESPLHRAVENMKGGLAITKFLCEEAGFDGDKNRHCLISTPVYLATKCNNIEVVRYLVEQRRADPTAADGEGCSACYVAAYYNYHEIIRILLKNGANSSIMYKNLMTPAISAASSNSLEAMIALAEGGGDVSTPFSTSSNVIDYARQRGNDRIAEYLISFGAK